MISTSNNRERRSEKTMSEQNITGFPSIDKPWLKYYSEEAINVPLPECTLIQYIKKNNQNNLYGTALNYYGNEISYKQFFEHVNRAAASLFSLGIRCGDVVTIAAMHIPETVYMVYGLNTIGAVANMVYLTASPREIANSIKDTKSKAFVYMSVICEKVNQIRDEIKNVYVISLNVSDSMPWHLKALYRLKNTKETYYNEMDYSNFLKRGGNSIPQEPLYKKNTPAVIVHTSGTTGIPKGVVLSNDNLNAVAVQYYYSSFEFHRDDSYMDMLPPFLGFGMSIGMHLPLTLGLEVILYIDLEPARVVAALKKIRPKHFPSGPVIVSKLLESGKTDLSFLSTFAGGGESLTIEQEHNFNTFLRECGFNGTYMTGYGMTECSATLCTGMPGAYREGTLGIPLPKVTAKIIEPETENELSYGETGEICFNAPNVMLGYWDNQKETENVLRLHKDGRIWLHTGDLGLITQDGFLQFKGRIKKIYLTKGCDHSVYKLFPLQVETAIKRLPFVLECGVVAVPDKERIYVTFAFVHTTTILEKKRMKKSIQGYLSDNLPTHEIPQDIIFLDSMPTTPSGKVDYRTLERMAAGESERTE